MTTRRKLLIAIGASSLTAPAISFAQLQGKVWRVGYLGAASAAGYAVQVDALRTGLRELGYVEGKNLVIEFRWAEGRLDRLGELAADLARLAVDVIVTHQHSGVSAAKRATATIPIVIAV